MSAPTADVRAPAGPSAVAERAARGGRFLTFYLAEEEYGVEILKVQEIIGMQPISSCSTSTASSRPTR
jgi:purine-binding chemotaxis protein CheW